MRSSKSRSRSKANRPRTLGNIVNRVFDSSGPEGKVRGTPQQIIEKYQALARDAQLSNDRVAAENFLQHAEHYTRLLAEAMREMAAEAEQRNSYGQQNGQQGNWQGQGGNASRQDNNRPDLGEGEQPYGAPMDMVDGAPAMVDLPEQDRGQGAARQMAQRPQPRNGDARQGENRANDGRQQSRPRDDRTRDDRPRDERPRDDRPRDDRPRDERPRDERSRIARPRDETPRVERARPDALREDQPRDAQPASATAEQAPSLRFVDGPLPAPAPAPERPHAAPPAAPVFVSPADLVAQVVDKPLKNAPKPRAPRAKAKPTAENATIDQGALEIDP